MWRWLSSLLLLSCLLWTAEVPALESRRATVSLSAEESARRKAAAKAVLERWLAAQNTGDFAGYMALYAQQFHGVRRSRLQTVRLNRASWAKDRGKMFTKPMKVAMEDVQILRGKTMIRVLLLQHWFSGNYTDVGPKRIDLAENKGAWLIEGEDMLASHPPTQLDVVPATQAGQFAFAHEGDVVLARAQDLCDGSPAHIVCHVRLGLDGRRGAVECGADGGAGLPGPGGG